MAIDARGVQPIEALQRMSDSSDDEESGVFSFLKSGATIQVEDDSSVIRLVDYLLLTRDGDNMQRLLSIMPSEKAIQCMVDVLNGKHIKVLSDGPFSIDKMLQLIMLRSQQPAASDMLYQDIKGILMSELEEGTSLEREWKCLYMLAIGVAYLELYVQINYTGPELSGNDTEVVIPEDNGKTIHENSINVLEVDGEYCFSICQAPQLLLISRLILSILADNTRPNWKHGIRLSPSGDIVTVGTCEEELVLSYGAKNITSRHWHSARASMIHLRLLQKQGYDHTPTLWKECLDNFTKVLGTYGGAIGPASKYIGSKRDREKDDDSVSGVTTYSSSINNLAFLLSDVDPKKYFEPTNNFSDKGSVVLPASMKAKMASQAWLEWGLCCHHFDAGDKGKLSFLKAKGCAGLYTLLTAAMGKRTKYQKFELAQMYLLAKSSLVTDSKKEELQEEKQVVYKLVEKLPVQPEEGDSSWVHAEWELGRRVVSEVEGGSEAAVREVMLDSQDGGAIENILLEGGPKFTEEALNTDKGGRLHPVDQAVILSLCLDVSNNNPVDGLTYEEMFPYMERVLMQAENWMIHSTALLERSWLEFEKRRTMDRAMLQIQALLDQHTTKLTLTQSTYKCIEESAPAQDRLSYIHCIVYPSQYELKRDLAFRYLKGCVFQSALNLFRELELWDEVVTCYQLLEKPQRAELVVRERLKYSETPYMLTALGDLTNKTEYYERAWTISNHRYCRAKRTLARVYYDRKDYRTFLLHIDEALAVQPLVPKSWYLKGIACMHLEEWDLGLEAFTRCVQQDMEIAEAWGNIGAIFMKMRAYAKAYPALHEALKQQRDNWKVVENVMYVTLTLGKWREAIEHMSRLVDLRMKSKRPVHKEELKVLVGCVSDDIIEAQRDFYNENTDDSATFKLPEVGVQLEKLLVKITESVNTEPELWGIFAEYYEKMKKFRLGLECRVKEFRGYTTANNWEKELVSVTNVAEKAKIFVSVHTTLVSQAAKLQLDIKLEKSDWYSCKSLLQTALRGIAINYRDSDAYHQVNELIQEVEKYN